MAQTVTAWPSSSSRCAASRRARWSPRENTPTSTRSPAPRLRSTISCAIRESERRIWSPSITVALTLRCSTALMPAFACKRTSFPRLSDGLRAKGWNRSREHLVQQRHPDEQAVAGLPEVGGARVGVDLRRDLVHPRQRVHDDRILAQPRHRFAVDAVDALDLEV